MFTITDPRSLSRRWEIGLIGCLMLVAAALRFWRLGAGPLGYDEIYTWMVTRFPLGQIVLTPFDTNPPIYWVIEWIVTRFGDSEQAMRFSSAVAGVVAVPVLHLAARSRLGAVGALAAAGFLATAPLRISYSQTARAYEVQQLLLIVAAFCFLGLIEKIGQTQPKRRIAWRASGYALSAILALYTHYSSAFLLLIANIAVAPLVVKAITTRAFGLRAWFVANSVIALAALPFVMFSLKGGGRLTDWLMQISFLDALRTIRRALVAPEIPSVAALLVLGIVSIGLVALWTAHRRMLLGLAVLALLGLPLTEWVIGFAKPVLNERTVQFALIGGAVAIGAAVGFVRHKLAAAAILAVVAGEQAMADVAYFDRSYDIQYKGTSDYLMAHVRGDDAVLFCGEYFPYYPEPTSNVFKIEPDRADPVLHEIHEDAWFRYNMMPVMARQRLSASALQAVFARDHKAIIDLPGLLAANRHVWFVEKGCATMKGDHVYTSAILFRFAKAGFRLKARSDFGVTIYDFERAAR